MAAAMFTAPAPVVAALRAGKVLAARIMAGIPHMAIGIVCFIRMEVVKRLFPTPGERSDIAMMRVKPVIHVAVEAAWPMEPWSRSNKDPPGKPVGSIEAIGSAVVRRVIEIAIWAHRRRPDIDRYLGRSNG